MSLSTLPETIEGLRVHLVGAKGTGMAALAEILASRGARLSGSDVSDVFFTDAMLARIGLFCRPFDAANVDATVRLVVHSAAYRRDQHPELREADRLGIPVLLYTEALGALSRRYDSSGIAGVHGKTTTTALSGVVARAFGLPATILAGAGVSSFEDKATLVLGDRYFIAETCEYQRHFLAFSPRRIVLTSVESDHQDYYPTYEDIRDAFVEYALTLPSGGILVYCADDPGALETVGMVRAKRGDLRLLPYGFTAEGPWQIQAYAVKDERAEFRLAAFARPLRLRVPGRHLALDAAAAIALGASILAEARDWDSERAAEAAAECFEALREGLEGFGGSRRRSEILGEAGGILFMDDYGHHPSAIRTTLAGLREFYPDRRLVVDFMSHTYSRTKALLPEFAASLGDAHELWLHKIYASARETPDGTVDGRSLYSACAALHSDVHYIEEPLEAEEALATSLRPGDLFLTLGAGDNFALGHRLLKRIAAAQKETHS